LNKYSKETVIESKKYYQKDFMKTVYGHKRDTQLKTLEIFDIYVDYVDGMSIAELTTKYNYSSKDFLNGRLNVARARISVYVRLKELGHV
jgi:Mor family transcriptional regulator